MSLTQQPADPHGADDGGSVFVIQTMEALRVFFEPFRSRIMRELAERPRSVRELSDDLGVPQTKLYYHIHLLEEHGLIVVADEPRPSSERVYRSTARDFVVHAALLSLSDDPAPVELDSELTTVLDSTKVEIRSSAQRGVIDMRRTFPDQRALLIQHTHSAIPSSLVSVFKERLDQLIAEFDALGSVGAARADEVRAAFGFTVCLYPTDDPESERPVAGEL